MKKLFILLLAVLVSLPLGSCGRENRRGSAEAVLSGIIGSFGLQSAGTVYSDGKDAKRELSDGMLSSMFAGGGNIGTFSHVVSCAAYFSLKFSGDEIVVIELCDISHRGEIYDMCERRAAKKKNAVVYAEGRFVYLICTDFNADVTDYIRKH